MFSRPHLASSWALLLLSTTIPQISVHASQSCAQLLSTASEKKQEERRELPEVGRAPESAPLDVETSKKSYLSKLGRAIKGRFLPRLHVTNLETKRDVDPRLAWNDLAEASGVLTKIDNFSSAATQQLVFHKLGDVEARSLKDLDALPSAAVEFLRSKQPIQPEILEFLLQRIESRAILALRIVAAATQTSLDPSESAFNSRVEFVRQCIATGLTEISKKRGTKKWLTDGAVDQFATDEFRSYLSQKMKDAENKPLSIASDQFDPQFLADVSSIPPTGQEIVFQVGELLENRLTQMPIGIALKPVEATTNIIFGDRHYYGNYNNYKSVSARAWDRVNPKAIGAIPVSKNLNGAIEAELNTSNYKKKALAIIIDQTHQNLDSISGLEDIPGRCLNTCGSYPTYALWQANIPLITPTYYSGEPTIASLGLQYLLGLPTVKDFRVTNMNVKTALVGLPIVYLHGYNGMMLEMVINIWLVSKAAGLAGLLFSM